MPRSKGVIKYKGKSIVFKKTIFIILTIKLNGNPFFCFVESSLSLNNWLNFYQITHSIQRFFLVTLTSNEDSQIPEPGNKKIPTFITRSVSNLILNTILAKDSILAINRSWLFAKKFHTHWNTSLLRDAFRTFWFYKPNKVGVLVNLYLYTNIEAAKTKELFVPLQSHLLNPLSISKIFFLVDTVE